jgi:hypothetical protein
MIRRAARSASSQAFDALSHDVLGCGEHLSVGLSVDVDAARPHDREGIADGEHRLRDSINTPEELVDAAVLTLFPSPPRPRLEPGERY